MNETYKELTKNLYIARRDNQFIQDELKTLRDDFETEIESKKLLAKQLAKAETDAKTAIIGYAKLADKTNTLDADGPVQMKNGTEIKIDQAKALEWARVNMPVAIIEMVNEDSLKPYAEANPEWATVNKVRKPNVATDLSKFIGKE